MKALLLLINALLATALLATSGCPWRAAPTPSTAKPPATEADAYLIEVTADSQEVTIGSGTPSTIQVDVRLKNSGRPPRDLTTVALSTDQGGFGSVNGPAEITLQLIGGHSQAALFAGSLAGTATAGSSSGGANVWISSPKTSSNPGLQPKSPADECRDPGATADSFSGTEGTHETGAVSILPAAFQYGAPPRATAIAPGSGLYTGGTRVTLSAPGIDGPLAVSLGGIGQSVNKVRGSEVVFTTAGIPLTSCPASGFVIATGVRVVNTGTGDSDDADLSFKYLVPLPRIFGVRPAGGGGVGTSLTLTGVNFAPNVQVQFGDPAGGASAQVVYVNPTTAVVRVPTPAADFDFREEASIGTTCPPGRPAGGAGSAPTPCEPPRPPQSTGTS